MKPRIGSQIVSDGDGRINEREIDSDGPLETFTRGELASRKIMRLFFFPFLKINEVKNWLVENERYK